MLSWSILPLWFCAILQQLTTLFIPRFSQLFNRNRPIGQNCQGRKEGAGKTTANSFLTKTPRPCRFRARAGALSFMERGYPFRFFHASQPVQQPGSVHEAGCCLFQPLLIFPQKKSPAALTGLLHPQMCMQYTQPDSSTKNRQVLVFPFFPKTAKGTQAVLPQFFWMFFLLFLEIVLILAKAIFDWAVIPIRERISSPAVPVLPSGLWRAGPGRKYPVRCSPPRKAGR